MTTTDRPVAVVTGAAGGLGAATCRRLGDAGWRVVAADLAGPRLDALAAVANVEAEALDVTDRESVDDLADRVTSRHDAVGAVVNFAGLLEVGPMIELPESVVAAVLEVNLFGTYRVNQAFYDAVERCRGRIVNISSETGWQSGGPFNGAYAMSKHAIEAYSDSLRRELMFRDVTVIKIQPGPFRTGMVASIGRRFAEAADSSDRFGDLLRRTGELAAAEEDRAHDPERLARVVERALSARRPRAAYSVSPAWSRRALDLLPTRLADAAIRRALRP